MCIAMGMSTCPLRVVSCPTGLRSGWAILIGCLLIGCSQAFPYIYQWMTFGITSLLERIWEHQLPLLRLDKKPSPQMVEMCAMLERALAYAHTGNAKVLASSIMRPFWLIRSLLQQGWPTMAPTICLITTTAIPVSVSPSNWPIVTRSNLPAIASQRAQIITYGLEHFEASSYFVSIRLLNG